jgi:hypothetical protein
MAAQPVLADGRTKERAAQARRAKELIRAVCAVAGSTSLIDEIDAETAQAGLTEAVALGHTAPVFDWLLTSFSYQGISDAVARNYIAKHGAATWSGIGASLASIPSCPKLRAYWAFEACRYDKGSFSCSQPDHIDGCPVPRPRLRNGRLNQTAYSLFLFVRDVAGGDLVGWLDSQLTSAASLDRNLWAARQEALIGPLRNVYGVSDKVLTMALSSLLIGARNERPHWFEIGKAMIAVDTLVHNFLHRTGILGGCGTPHQFGAACYRPGGCTEVIRAISRQIDARAFNPKFPQNFPRFVQHAIWRFCAADGLNLCNGNRINDEKSCGVTYCYLYRQCEKLPLKPL